MNQRSRGRPRAYDPDKAIREATATFWDSGYEGSSMDALSSAMGMNRPSLYNAFGDKHALYLRTMDEYRAFSRKAATEILRSERSLAEALRAFYQKAIDIYLSGDRGARGCFLVGTAVSETIQDHEIRDSLAAGLHELDDLLEERLRRATVTGDLHTATPLPILARLICVVMNGIAVRARAGESRSNLEEIAEATIRLVLGKDEEPWPT
jgi:AcrR family transcriptional regulator